MDPNNSIIKRLWCIIWDAPCLWAYVDSEGPEQPAHPCSLIRAFASQQKESVDAVVCFKWGANAEMRLSACAG